MNAAGLRRASGFVKADACCKVVLNARFFYSSMALVAEMSAFIICAANVMRNVLREGLLNPKKGGMNYFSEIVCIIINFIFINNKRRITWISTKG
jgi:hypothetical protein